jgi:hypothetical protein
MQTMRERCEERGKECMGKERGERGANKAQVKRAKTTTKATFPPPLTNPYMCQVGVWARSSITIAIAVEEEVGTFARQLRGPCHQRLRILVQQVFVHKSASTQSAPGESSCP